MAIQTAPAAAPLRAREPVLIAFVLVAIFANCALSAVIEQFNYPNWASVVQAGLVTGQCLVAILLAGLMGRSWLGAYGTTLGIALLCVSAAMCWDWWRYGIDASDLLGMPCIFPLPLLIAAVPTIALRQLSGLRIAKESGDSWSRRGLSIGDIFIAVAFTSATLVFARVGILSSNQDITGFWAETSMMGLLGFGMGMLIVVPAVWCVFVVESRRNMVIGLGGLLILPSAIAAGILAFVSAESLSLEEKVEGIGLFALASVAAAVFFVPLLLLLHRRGYRLLRVPLSRVNDPPTRFRHVSRWIVGAIVGVAAIVNFRIAPIEKSQQRERQFERWVRSLGGTAEEAVDQTWLLGFGDATVDDDDLKFLPGDRLVVRLVLSGTDITDAGLEYVGQLNSLETLDLNDTAVTDRGLQHLRHLPNLKSLSLQNTGVTGSAFAEFESRGKIVEVDLNGAAVTDEGCQGIGELTALQELNLRDTSITDAGLRHLGDLRRLEQLDLSNTVLNGNGFAHFKEMPALSILHLSGSRCGDGVSLLVSRAPQLHELHLDRTAITDEFMSTLQGSTTIVELELSGTSVTDDGLSALGELPSLHMLGLNGTSVTGSGFRELSARRLERLLLQGTPMSDESLAHLKRFPRLQSIFLNDTPIGDGALSRFAGRWFHELNVVGTQVTAKGLLRAHFDVGELTVDDQQANNTELAALDKMYESLIVVPKGNEVGSD